MQTASPHGNMTPMPGAAHRNRPSRRLVKRVPRTPTPVDWTQVLRGLARRRVVTLPTARDGPDTDNFEPIEIRGEPLSETILRDRR